MYCETCDLPICKYCTIKDHEGHNYDLVADMFLKCKQQLERELQPAKQQLSVLDAALQALDERADQISAQGEEVEQLICNTTQEAIKAMQESEKKLREDVRAMVQQKRQLLFEQKEEIESNRAQLMSFQEFVEEKVGVESQEQVLAVKRQMVERTRAVSSQLSSSKLQPLEEANIKFTVNKEALSECSKLGEVNSNIVIASQVVATGKGKEVAKSGQKASFELTTSSRVIPSVPLNPNLLSCQLTAPNSSQPVECTITPTQPGSCTVDYTPVVHGPHQLRITVRGSDIPGSPFTIHVLPTPEMRGCPLQTITGLKNPWGVAVTESGEMVVSEVACECISVFSKEGVRIRSFGSHGSGEVQFNSPSGIALTHDSQIIVVDESNHRLQLLTLEGNFVASVGTKGNGQLQFNYPIGVMVHPSGDVFVADTGNHRIQVLNSDLSYSHMFGSSGVEEGQFRYPKDIAYDSHGDVYVAESGSNNRVQKFTSSGQFISSFQIQRPRAICVDSTDTVYVSSEESHVSVYDNEGRLLTRFKCGERKEGFYTYHYALAVDKTGNLYVCDSPNGCLVIY